VESWDTGSWGSSYNGGASQDGGEGNAVLHDVRESLELFGRATDTVAIVRRKE
jgi:hypothetical protein